MSYNQEYYLKNKRAIIARVRSWQKDHSSQFEAYSKEYYRTHKKKILRKRFPNVSYSFHKDFLKPLMLAFTSSPLAQALLAGIEGQEPYFKIMQALQAGKTQIEIAEILQISQKTVHLLINEKLSEILHPIIKEYNAKETK